MASIRIGIAAALALAAAAIVLPATSAAQTGKRTVECTHTLTQYNEAIRILSAEAAEARALAARNPLYESDVAYYASVLATAHQCVKTLAPVATAAR